MTPLLTGSYLILKPIIYDTLKTEITKLSAETHNMILVFLFFNKNLLSLFNAFQNLIFS